MKLLIFLFCFLIFSFSLIASTDCETLSRKSCIYTSENFINSPTKVLIYHRGHLNGQSDFPANRRIRSARNIITYNQFGLVAVANKNNLLLIVNGSSRVDITKEELHLVLTKYKVKLDRLYIAAHSGGYYGLNNTLRNLHHDFFIEKIMMLDSYYSTNPSGLLGIMPNVLSEGTLCTGFHTRHNKERLKNYYQNDEVYCHSEGPEGMNHNESVGPILMRQIE